MEEPAQMFTDLNQAINGVYPIVDPGALNVVEGFSIDSSNAAVAGSGSQAPMPVKWLYVLEDGKMVAGTGVSGTTVTVAGASATNPIVGRVAFWTDDETSKVNVNTAGEGEFWDTPKSGSRDDMQFAANPPVKYEFQRTPGHPAMTSLSAVFPELMTADRWGSTSTYRQELRRLYTLTPRVSGGKIGQSGDGGSEGGTLPVTSYTTDYSLRRFRRSLPKSLSIRTGSMRRWMTSGSSRTGARRAPSPAPRLRQRFGLREAPVLPDGQQPRPRDHALRDASRESLARHLAVAVLVFSADERLQHFSRSRGRAFLC